ERGHTVEVDTPHLAATIDQPGYYRVDVDQEATTFISRRGGSASVVPAGGEAVDLGANDEVIVKGADNPEVERYTAPNLDPWERCLGVDRYRGARGQLGAARLGRAVHSVVGTARVLRRPVVGRVGWPAHRQQRGRRAHDHHPCQPGEHLPQHAGPQRDRWCPA